MKERGQSRESDGGMHGVRAGITDGRTIRDSMEYYRMWIFSSNAVLGLTSAIFIVFGAFVMADARLSLLRDVEFYHPTFLYAYVALLLQCGLLQVIGCLGAKNLSEKLLSLYWASLLLLTIGDIVVGLFWVFKLDSLKTNLRGRLGEDFLNKYSIDPRFTEVWNRVQSEEHCCGVNGPQDFNRFLSSVPVRTPSNEDDPQGATLSLPDSCCTIRIQHISSATRKKRSPKTEVYNSRRKRHKHDGSDRLKNFFQNQIPPNLNFSVEASLERASAEEVGGDINVPLMCRHLPRHGHLSELLGITEPQPIRGAEKLTQGSDDSLIVADNGVNDLESDERRHRVRHVDGSRGTAQHTAQVLFRARNKVRVYRNGCGRKMEEWVEWVSGVLFILGFCILGFSKFCFLVILRREIREMIEKIQILKKEAKGGPAPLPPGVHNPKPRNSIHKQYSTQSGAMSTVSGVSMTGITIKSPPGECHYFTTLTHPVNNNPRRGSHYDHHVHITQHEAVGGRRHSARSLGTDLGYIPHRKSQSQSQETVHLSLLMSSQENGAKRSPNEGEESISFKVPTPEEREGKRAQWANGSPWELNISGDSSVSGPCGYDPASPPGTLYSVSSNSPAPLGRQELVEVALEKGPLSTGSSVEEPGASPQQPLEVVKEGSPTGSESGAVPNREELIEDAVPIREIPIIDSVPITEKLVVQALPDPEELSIEAVPSRDATIIDGMPDPEKSIVDSMPKSEETILVAMPNPEETIAFRTHLFNSNGNNNFNKDFDLDSDYVMALIGTPV